MRALKSGACGFKAQLCITGVRSTARAVRCRRGAQITAATIAAGQSKRMVVCAIGIVRPGLAHREAVHRQRKLPQSFFKSGRTIAAGRVNDREPLAAKFTVEIAVPRDSYAFGKERTPPQTLLFRNVRNGPPPGWGGVVSVGSDRLLLAAIRPKSFEAGPKSDVCTQAGSIAEVCARAQDWRLSFGVSEGLFRPSPHEDFSLPQ